MNAGRDPLGTILDASHRLMQARLKLATDRKSRTQAIEENLERQVAYEKLVKSKLNAGKSRVYDLAQAKAGRLLAEILLAKQNGPSDEKTSNDKTGLLGLKKALVQELQRSAEPAS